jgi:O-antigen ligase
MKLVTQKRASTLFLVGLFVTSLLITPLSADPVNIPKFVSLVFFSSLCFVICLTDIKIRGLSQIGSIGAASIIFMAAAILVSTFSNSDVVSQLYGSTGRNIGLFTLISLAIFMIVGILLASENLLGNLVSILIAVTLLSAIYGAIQYMNLDPLAWDSNFGKIFGFFGNPNFQSAMLGLGGIAGAGLLLTGNQNMKKKFLTVCFLVLLLISILNTQSYQGYLVFLIGTVFILYAKLFKSAPRKIHALFLALLLFGPFMGYLFLVKNFPTNSIVTTGSLNQRATYWEVGFRVWQQNPIFGTGLDTFGESFRRYRNLKNIEAVSGTITNSSHNFYIDILANGGLILFLPVVFITAITIIAIWKILSNLKVISSPAKIIIGVWIGLFTQALISPNQIGLLVWFWGCAGVIVGFERSSVKHLQIDNDGRVSKLNKKNLKRLNQLDPSQLITSFASIFISLAVALPPYVASIRYLDALKSGQVERIYSAASIYPMDVSRSVAIIDAFSNNQFYSQAHSLALNTVERYPNSYVAWNQLFELTDVSPEEKKQALLNMRRLDPFNPSIR